MSRSKEYFDDQEDFTREYKDYRYAIAKRLHDKRMDAGLTIEEARKRAHLSKTTLSRLENGTADIKSFELFRLCDTYNTTVDYIIYGKSETESVTSIIETKILKLNQSNQERMLKILNEYLELFKEQKGKEEL